MTANLPFADDRNEIEKLLELMNALRTPKTGCPWDLEQDFRSIAPYTIEEAYEVSDAIERDAFEDLKSELGDLLFQVVFHSQMASEKGLFSFYDVVKAITDKMVRRHPHVFGSDDERTAAEQTVAWEEMKAAERGAGQPSDGTETVSALDGVANTLPPVTRAFKLQKRAARVGFDWPHASDVLDKLSEETTELEAAIKNQDIDNIEEEIGDMLFVMVNLARKLDTDPDAALKRTNRKFLNRFKDMERLANVDGKTFSELELDQQEALWQRVKKAERADQDS